MYPTENSDELISKIPIINGETDSIDSSMQGSFIHNSSLVPITKDSNIFNTMNTPSKFRLPKTTSIEDNQHQTKSLDGKSIMQNNKKRLGDSGSFLKKAILNKAH